MKPLYAILLLLLVGGFVLNRSYASIYYKIGDEHLMNPNLPGVYEIGKTTNSTQKTVYVAMGDSLTAGVGVTNNNDSYPYLLSQHLAQASGTTELINLGFPSAKTQDVIDSQIAKTIASNPSVITLLIGINDVHDLVPVSTFKKNYQYIVDELTSKTKAGIILINIPYLGSPNLIRWPFNKLYQYRIEQFNNTIKELALQKNIPLVDLYTATKNASINQPEYYSSDLFHPSAKAYREWSEIIYKNSRF